MKPGKIEYDVIVVGAGPNGLAAAITIQQAGHTVLLMEGSAEIGGGLRSAPLTLPHFVHDVCSAVHPLAVGSPFFSAIPLSQHGLQFIVPPVAAAHPFEDGSCATLSGSVDETAESLGADSKAYRRLMGPLVSHWNELAKDALAPLHFPKHPLLMARFGLKGLRSAVDLSKRFRTSKARGLWAGMAAHSIQPLSNLTTAASALVLMAAGHAVGWPIARNGSQSIAKALGSYFISLGGTIETNVPVNSFSELPSSRAILFDVSPRQLLKLAGEKFSTSYRRQLSYYRYGMGVFKIDWALDGSIPFTAPGCRQAGTIHLGNTFEEIAESEEMTSVGKIPERPFVLLAQQSLFDGTRAPAGKQTAWAYCHVPNGSTIDMSDRIEKQVERFAPGFREKIIARSVMNTTQLEAYNPNYVGGDITGGIMDLRQLFTRPALRLSPYRTSAKNIYICSASSPPGGGIHGMCGYYAAKRALKDVFDQATDLV